MQPEIDPQDCLNLVEQSPAAVAAHDKQAWMRLFARFSLVEDPVGSRPCVSRPGDTRGLSAFYETFIAPNDIRFEVSRDIVCGLHVVRDLTIHITMASGQCVSTPAHLLYELEEEGGKLKIFRLAAHWELREAMRQQSAGFDALWRMLRHLGVGGVFGFLRGLASVGEDGREKFRQLQRALNDKHPARAAALFSPGVKLHLVGSGERLPVEDILRLGEDLVLGKTLVSGHFISASIAFMRDGQQINGVALLGFNRRTGLIEQADFYCSPAA